MSFEPRVPSKPIRHIRGSRLATRGLISPQSHCYLLTSLGDSAVKVQ